MTNPWRERVLTEEQLSFFKEQGYIVIPNVISSEKREELVEGIWRFSQLDPKNKKTWYSDATTLARNGFLEMYHHPTQWEVRTDPKIYNIFADLLEWDKLWVSIDRVCLKLPSKEKFKSSGFFHWDYDVWEPAEQMQLQGVIALQDTTKNMGGFHCAPGMHTWIADWAKTHKISANPRKKFISDGIPINVPKAHEKELKKFDQDIEMKAGDLVIWRGELAHGNGTNLSEDPRVAMYLTMFPAAPEEHEWLSNNINIWARNLPGNQAPYPQIGWTIHERSGDSRKIEQRRKKPVELSELGERLVGVQMWE